nr:hypothetical protein CFP56_02561 [Quercus suber]
MVATQSFIRSGLRWSRVYCNRNCSFVDLPHFSPYDLTTLRGVLESNNLYLLPCRQSKLVIGAVLPCLTTQIDRTIQLSSSQQSGDAEAPLGADRGRNRNGFRQQESVHRDTDVDIPRCPRRAVVLKMSCLPRLSHADRNLHRDHFPMSTDVPGMLSVQKEICPGQKGTSAT